jgi:hypothetical protein
MKIKSCSWLVMLLLVIPAMGQSSGSTQEQGTTQSQPTPPGHPMMGEHHMMMRGPGRPGPRVIIRMRRPGMMGMHAEMGQWWKNSDIAKKLQLSDSQISKLDSTFLEHKLKLIDDGAEMQKEDLKLQALLDQDSPDEAQVKTQVDKELAAKSTLEREYTMMNLDLRKVLTVAQWHQLKAIRQERGPRENAFFFRKFSTGGMGGGQMMGHGPGPMMMPDPPDPPTPAGPAPDDMN